MRRRTRAEIIVLNRLVNRYGGTVNYADGPDLCTSEFRVEVVTSATLQRQKARLLLAQGPRYLAVTNKECIPEALQAVTGTPLGVMDPRGEILLPCAEDAG